MLSTTAQAASSRWSPGLSVSYGNTPDAWSSFRTVKASKNDLPTLLGVLRRNYGTYQASFAGVELSLERIPIQLWWIDYLHFYVRTEAAGVGEVHNPVLPELKAAFAFDEMAALKAEHFFRTIGLRSRLGLVYGKGKETRIQGFVTDFLETTPKRTGEFSFYGADLELENISYWNKKFYQWNSALYRPTWYLPTLGGNTYLFADPDRTKTARTKIRSATVYQTSWMGLAPKEFGPELVLGPQPLPVEIMPRIWEYVHQIYPWPEYGAMVGVGMLARWGSRDFQLITRAGLYAGYLGAFLGLKYGLLAFDLGSASIEESAAYKTRAQRCWLANLSLKF